MKTMCTVLVSAALLISAVSAVVLWRTSNRLRRELSYKDEIQKRIALENFRKSWTVGPYAEDRMFVRSCSEILSVVSNGQCSALNDYASALLRLESMPKEGGCGDAENAMQKVFHDGFLWRNGALAEFCDARSLDSYLRVNFDLMIHYANLDIRNGNIAVVPAKEYLTLKTLKEYSEKFKAEDNHEFEMIVSGYLDLLITHIESPYGFTRRCAHYLVSENTELANALRPGKGVCKESAINLGRAVAQGLVNCGYKPKWLDEDFPLPEGEKDVWGR